MIFANAVSLRPLAVDHVSDIISVFFSFHPIDVERRIIPAIIMHICNNSSTIIVMYIKMAVGESHYGTVDNVSRAVFIVLGIISAVFILRKYKLIDDEADKLPVNLPATEEEIEQAKTEKNRLKFKTFFSTWAFWIVAAYFIGMSILMMIAGSKIQ